MRYTGPRNKVSRREGEDLGLKTVGSKSHASLLRKLTIKPGQHGAGTKRRRKMSERSKQLREKQKLRFLFGVTETQLKNYFNTAKATKGNTALLLGRLLEQRLDNVVYKLNFAPTRASARQLVNHGHITVDSKVVTIPSYSLHAGAKIGFRKEESRKIPYIEAQISNKSAITPAWLERKEVEGVIAHDPDSQDIEKQVNMRSVIEFYSR